MPWLWLLFTGLIVLLVLSDLYGWHRGHTRPTRRGEFVTTGLYILLTFAIALVVHFAYETHWLGAGVSADGTSRLSGAEAASQFVTLTLWQFALDLDGVFVVSALFAHLRTPERVRHRVLLWSVLPAIAVRGGLILLGAWLSTHYTWIKFLLSGLLLLAALRMLVLRQENFDEGKNWILGFLRRFVPNSGRFDGNKLLTREGGRLAFTPLLAAVVLLQSADLWISMDSIPAALAISKEPFLLFASNGMALVLLRAVYVALEGLKGWLRYVKIGLACALAYAAVLTAMPRTDHPPTLESLLVLVLCVGAGMVFALRPRAKQDESVSPLGEEADRAAKMALRRARQAIVLVVGGTLLLAGVVMIPGPGPGIPIAFIALAILANEFAWAREMLHKYRAKVIVTLENSGAVARRHVRPWIMIPFYAFTVLFFTGLHLYARVPVKGAIIAAIPVLIGQSLWGYFTFVRAWRPSGGDEPPAPTNQAPSAGLGERAAETKP